MYRFIFVDDEDYMRSFFPPLLDWAQYDFELAGVFSNGPDALAFLKENPVDLVISDIKMGSYSGIDLCRDLRRLNLEIEIVLLSGYQDFEDARQAIKYNVFDYVLKPITFLALNQLFTTLRQRLDSNSLAANGAVPDSSLLLQQFLFDLSAGFLQDEARINSKLKEFGLPGDLMERPAEILSIHLLNMEHYLESVWKYGLNQFYTASLNLLNQSSDELFSGVFHLASENIDVVAVPLRTETGSSAVERLLKSFTDVLNVDCEIERAALPDGFRFYRRGISSEKGDGVSQFATQYSQAVMNEDFLKCKLILDSVFSQGDLESDWKFIREVLQVFRKTDGYPYDRHPSYPSLSAQIDPAQMKAGFLEIVQDYGKLCSNDRTAHNENLIRLARAYIRENYNRDISLNDVAGHVALNPAYFSRFFKQQTGENFIDYLTKIRVEKAIELLSDPKNKVASVCSQVGYSSSQHFYHVFKLYTGLTPTEFRNR